MDRTWTHTRIRRSVGAHAVEFSKTAAPVREGASFAESALSPEGLRRTAEYSAYLVRAPTPGAWERLSTGGQRYTPGGGPAARPVHRSRLSRSLARAPPGPRPAMIRGAPTGPRAGPRA